MKLYKKKPKGGENSHRTVKTTSLLFLTLVFVLVLCGAVSAETLPLSTNQSGTVSGDLYTSAQQLTPFNNQPQNTGVSEEATFNFASSYTNIEYAKLYTMVYVAGTDDRQCQVTVSLDGNNDGTYETTLENNTTLSTASSQDNTVYWQGDHISRVYSDYLLSYDVKNLINSGTVKTKVQTAPGTGTFDGRIKFIALIVAYNDGDSDKVDYWVNQGHDWINTGTTQTTFATSTITAVMTNATLTTVATSSKDGTYAFNEASLTGADPVAPTNYFETHTWNVTSNITSGASSTLIYGMGSGTSFKNVLATLKIKEEKENRFVNPGFETGDLTGWTAGSCTDINAFTHSGQYNAHFEWYGDQSTDFLQQNIDLTSVKSISFWGNAEGAPFSVYIDDVLVQSSNSVLNTWIQYVIPVSDYTGIHTVTLKWPGGGGADVDDFSVNLFNDADFTTDSTSGSTPLTVQFTDHSTNATSWKWDFTGDGTVDSTEQNPTYIYTTSGTYTVKLTTDGTGGSKTTIKPNYITVVDARTGIVAADGTGNFTSIQAAIDAASEWDTILVKSGTYTESLSVNTPHITIKGESADKVTVVCSGGTFSISASGCHVEDMKFQQINTIYVSAPSCVIRNNIIENPTTGITLTSSHNLIANNIILNPTSEWYGGGIIEGGDNDGWYYEGVGFNTIQGNLVSGATGHSGASTFATSSLWENNTFRDCSTTGLTIYGSGNTLTKNSFINNTYAIEICSGNTNSIENNRIYLNTFRGNSVPVTTSSTTPPTTIYWVSPHPLNYTYNGTAYSGILGNYWGSSYIGTDEDGNGVGNTEFTVPEGCGSDKNPLMNQTIDYNISETIIADFIATPINGSAPLTVQFMDQSTGSTSPSWTWNMVWDFNNDGIIDSHQQNPTYTYTTPGNYTVRLTVTNTSGSDSETKTDYITVNPPAPPVANFTATPTSGITPFAVHFTDQSTGIVTGWVWDFTGDGIVDSTLQNPTYTYTTAGNYTVKLTVSNAGGSDDEVKTEYITAVTDTQAPTVNATPVGGNITTATQVILSATDDLDSNPVIYYTTDGTDPNTSSTRYVSPININKTTTLKFIAVDVSGNIAPVQAETYTDTQAPTVSASIVGGTYNEAKQIILTTTDNADPNPVIYCTLDGTNPTSSSIRYTSSIIIAKTTTLEFIAVDASGNISQVQTETYTINDTEAPTVNASLASGTYNPPKQVILTARDNVDPNPVIYYTLDGTDPTTSSTLYTGAINITSTTTLKFIAVDANGNILPVQTEVYTINDTEAPTVIDSQSRTTVTLSATDNADPNPKIYYTVDGSDPTTNSTPYGGPITIPRAAITLMKFIAVDLNGNTSPVQSKTYNTTYPTDLLTSYYAEGHVGVIVDNGGTGYHGGDPVYNLSLPANTTILAAHLYIAWNWYGYFPSTVSFNGHTFTGPTIHYADGNDGQDMFDVTQYFNVTDTNTAQIINGNSEGVYGRTLIVVYQSASEPYRKIWVNEGYDIIPSYSGYGATEGPGHAFFQNVTTDKISSAEVIITLPSGDNDSPNILLNGQTFTINSTGGSDPSFKYYDITPPTLQNGTNTLEVPNGGYMSLANAILTLTIAPAAGFTANTTSGFAPLTVQFTDQSTDATSYAWDFDNNGTTESTEQNPVCTYSIPGTYTVKLTVTGPGGADEETKTNYITVNEPVPVAQFVAVSTSGSSPLTVTFTDQSTNATSYAWDFNNDETVDSTDQNPTWIYDRPGTYTIKLSVTGPGGNAEETKTDYITVNKSTQPDLLATDMKVTSSSYVNYSLVEVTMTNIGEKTTGFFNVALYDNGTLIGEQYTYWMLSDKDRTLYFIWSPSTIGEHHLQAIIDKNNNIQESNENNNQITQLVDNRPDLTPTELKAKTLPLKYCYVTVDVTNNGEDLTAFYDVTLYDNRTQIGQQKIYGLKTGETKTITYLCKLTSSSSHTLQATTDASSTIPETDEINNTITKQL